MNLLQRIQEYCKGYDVENNGYWIYYQPRTILIDRPYDGKFKVHRTYEQIQELVPRLIPLLQDKRIAGFKYKSSDTQSITKYAHLLPPIFIYTQEKNKEAVGEMLDNLGLEDKVWITDKREALQLVYVELALRE